MLIFEELEIVYFCILDRSKTSADQASADQASADQASADQASADQASADQASADQASADQASADQASDDQVSDDQTLVAALDEGKCREQICFLSVSLFLANNCSVSM